MNWININKEHPPDNNDFGGKTYLVTIRCDSWESQKTMIMEWEITTVRNKVVKRWRWKDSIKHDAWIVTHWMELPPPATD